MSTPQVSERKTAEKVYHFNDKGRVLKRSLRPDEYHILSDGEPFIPLLVVERLKNEVACMTFIREHTNIPVPKVLKTYEENGSYHVWMELIDGVEMSELTSEQQTSIFPQSKLPCYGFLWPLSKASTPNSSKHCLYFTKSSLEAIRGSNRNSLSTKYNSILSFLWMGTTILAEGRVRFLPWRFVSRQHIGGP